MPATTRELARNQMQADIMRLCTNPQAPEINLIFMSHIAFTLSTLLQNINRTLPADFIPSAIKTKFSIETNERLADIIYTAVLLRMYTSSWGIGKKQPANTNRHNSSLDTTKPLPVEMRKMVSAQKIAKKLTVKSAEQSKNQAVLIDKKNLVIRVYNYQVNELQFVHHLLGLDATRSKYLEVVKFSKAAIASLSETPKDEVANLILNPGSQIKKPKAHRVSFADNYGDVISSTIDFKPQTPVNELYPIDRQKVQTTFTNFARNTRQFLFSKPGLTITSAVFAIGIAAFAILICEYNLTAIAAYTLTGTIFLMFTGNIIGAQLSKKGYFAEKPQAIDLDCERHIKQAIR